MDLIIKYLKVMIIPTSCFLSFPFIFSLFNLIGLNTSKVIVLLLMIVVMLISGFLIGRKVLKKGYLNGFILGMVTSLIMFMISLFFKNEYMFNTLIYYLILIIASTIGSMFGVQKNKV